MALTPSLNVRRGRVNYLCRAYPVDPSTGNEKKLLFSSKPFASSTEQAEARLEDPFSYKKTAWSHDGNLLGGIVQVDFGGVVIDNRDGALDYLFEYAWRERKIKILFGEEGNPESSYTVLFEGKVEGVRSAKTSLVLEIYDRKYELDDVIQKERFEGTGDGNPNSITGPSDLKDIFMPLCLGEVKGANPTLINASISLWQWHHRSLVDSVSAVRDGENALVSSGDVTLANISDPVFVVANGNYVTNLANGLIRTGATPTDTLNMDCKGGKYQMTITAPPGQNNDDGKDPDAGTASGTELFADTPGMQVEAILFYYGSKSIARDPASRSELSGTITAKTGFYLAEGEERTRREVISALMGPFGYWFFFKDDGLAYYKRLSVPTGLEANAWLFGVNDIRELEVLEIQPPWLSCEATYGDDQRYTADYRPKGTIDPKQKRYRADNQANQNTDEIYIDIKEPDHGQDFEATGPNIEFTATAFYNTTEDISSSIVWDVGVGPDLPGSTIYVPRSLLGTGAHLIRCTASKTITGTPQIEDKTVEGYLEIYVTIGGVALPDLPPRIDVKVWREAVSPVIETLCVEEAGAQEVAEYWLSLHEVVRYVIRVKLSWLGYDIQLGDEVKITYPRYGFDKGRGFIVISIDLRGKDDETTLVLWG